MSTEVPTRHTADSITDDALDALYAERDALLARLGPVEAAVAAVAVKAHEWAALAPVDDWGYGPHDAVLADTGRYLIQLMAQPQLVATPNAEPAERSA